MELAAFRPRLVDALKGYDRHSFFSDLGAGLTVGIVALPLAMAFAIASGVKPEQGLFTAIIGGFIIAALGGSSVQIGGPAGAFIVIVYGIGQRYGLTNLLIATALAGVLLFALGLFRLGALVRYIPVTIVIGFTNGIAVLIAFSQVKDLLGLSIDKLPSDFFAQVQAIATQLHTLNLHALVLGGLTVLMLFAWPRLFRPGALLPSAALEGRTLRTAARVPGPILALVLLSALAYWLHMPVETIGSRFGGIPQSLPRLELPPFSWQSAKELLFPTLTIAMLGAIESLLCARIADNLVNKPRHDPNQELMAQGVANFVVPFFGGIPVTGTIARTVTSIRAGAVSPIAGIVHSATLLAVVLVAAPLAASVPLSVLAGIVLFAAWNMGEWHEFSRLRRFSVPYRTVLLSTFFLTVVFDLTVAVQVGLVMACGFFIYRMSALFRVEAAPDSPPGVQVYRLYGALFFGAVGKLEAVSQALPPGTRAVVLEMHQLVSLDNSGLEALTQLQRALARQRVLLVLCDLNEQPRAMVHRAGFDAELGLENITTHLGAALTRATSATVLT
ncbi:MAG: STAS domain-containing protein [Rhizobacter sp.]|nr:STAS domain-containing protein [Rhizobacter sp.]